MPDVVEDTEAASDGKQLQGPCHPPWRNEPAPTKREMEAFAAASFFQGSSRLEPCAAHSHAEQGRCVLHLAGIAGSVSNVSEPKNDISLDPSIIYWVHTFPASMDRPPLTMLILIGEGRSRSCRSTENQTSKLAANHRVGDSPATFAFVTTMTSSRGVGNVTPAIRSPSPLRPMALFGCLD